MDLLWDFIFLLHEDKKESRISPVIHAFLLVIVFDR